MIIKKKLVIDLFLNAISSMLIMFALQFLLFPKIANSVEANFFGSFIFIYSLINFLGAGLGGAAQSTFFKYYAENKELNLIEYTFWRIFRTLLVSILILFIPLYIYLLYLGNNNATTLFIYFLFIFITLRIYLISFNRAHLQYKKIVGVNALLAIMYLILFFFYSSSINVFLALLICEVVFLIAFIIMNKKMISISKCDSRHNTQNYIKSFYILLLSSLLANLIKYLDRFYSDIFMGSDTVAVVYVASIIGQTFIVPLTIISSTLFSYIIQKKHMDVSVLYKVLIFLPLIVIAFFAVSFMLGPLLITALYPDYSAEAMPLFYIFNIGYSLLIFDYILRGFIIKNYSEGTKLIVDLCPVLFSLLLIYPLIKSFDSMGIAIALTISFGLKGLINVYLFYLYIRNKKRGTLK